MLLGMDPEFFSVNDFRNEDLLGVKVNGKVSRLAKTNL